MHLFNVYLLSIFSCFIRIRAKLTNFAVILAFVWHMYFVNWNVFLLCFLSYDTYSGTEYLDTDFQPNPECKCFFFQFVVLHAAALGCALCTSGLVITNIVSKQSFIENI